MKTTKSPRKVLQAAYAAAQKALPAYSHHYSPKKFTQHQLLSCLVLKEFLRLDYRGVMQLLIDAPGLQAVIQLQDVPHWTTLQKAADRLLKKTPRAASWIKRFRPPQPQASSDAHRR